MPSEQDANRALGIELQIEELVERRERAAVQHRPAEEMQLNAEIVVLYDELAAVADRACST
jgi:hypothetical protein